MRLNVQRPTRLRKCSGAASAQRPTFNPLANVESEVRASIAENCHANTAQYQMEGRARLIPTIFGAELMGRDKLVPPFGELARRTLLQMP